LVAGAADDAGDLLAAEGAAGFGEEFDEVAVVDAFGVRLPQGLVAGFAGVVDGGLEPVDGFFEGLLGFEEGCDGGVDDVAGVVGAGVSVAC